MVFNETFNSTVQLQPHADAHDSLIIMIGTEECGYVQYISYSQRCEYIIKTPSCRDKFYRLDYLKFVYCYIGTTTLGHGFAIFCLAALMWFIFSLIAETADRFSCPALAVISKTLRMGEALAGCTILALGNGIADLLGSWIDLDGDTSSTYAASFGSCIFVVSIVTGLLMKIRPFCPYPPYVVRDFVFLLFAVVYSNYIMMDGSVNISEACYLLVTYFFYIVCVIIDQIVIVQMMRDLPKRITDAETAEIAEKLERIQINAIENSSFEIYDDTSWGILDIEANRSTGFVGKTPNTNLFLQFAHSLVPIQRKTWVAAGSLGKIVLVLKAPIIFILLLAIPTVDYNQKNHGWSKLLNVMQILTTPIILLLVFGLMNLALFLCCLTFALPMMVIIFCSSRTDEPPPYHPIYALLSAAICLSVIQFFVGNVSSIMETLGITCQTSVNFLAVTVIAWGSGLVDLFSNVTLARQGHAKMGFAACLGSPIFRIRITISFGVLFLYKCLKSSDRIAIVHKGTAGVTIYVFLVSLIVFGLVGAAFAKFQVRRSMGYSFICIYILFLTYVILVEFEHIHGYGVDHHDQRMSLD